ncbi:hypothetical protein [Rathayibacter rathayi]|uniref:hypothetical protein n=1 Tax=Rathayibacter rathayi TaxID=33887 RepID=UPI0011AFE149|nr:hypothetical protein [Rathayibacter rathayi]
MAEPVNVGGLSVAASAATVSAGGIVDAPRRESVAPGDLGGRLGQRSALFEFRAGLDVGEDAPFVAVRGPVEPIGEEFERVDLSLPIRLSREAPGPVVVAGHALLADPLRVHRKFQLCCRYGDESALSAPLS